MNNEDEKLDLNLLKVFLEVYRLQSITLAADSMNMTQPGVSGALKRLRTQLGAELFVREGRGISPTHTAVQLAIQLEPAMQTVSGALSSVRQFDTRHPRTFNVSVNELMLVKLQPIIEKDSDLTNINIVLNIVPNNEQDLMYSLSMQKSDLALDIHKPTEASYKTELLLKDDLMLVARQAHPQIQRSITQEEYYSQKHVTLRLRRSDLYAADYFTHESLKPRRISAECDSLVTMLALISESDCIGSTSRMMADKYAKRFGLQVLEQPFATIPIEQMMIWHKRNDLSPAHIWLREKIRSYLR